MHTAVFLGWSAQEELSQHIDTILREDFDLIFSKNAALSNEVDQSALAALAPDFLFCFTPVIIRKPLLGAVRIAAINFHTAPPRWPGRGSCSFALLHGDTEFGVTAHIINEQIDAGTILHTRRFPITDTDDTQSLHHKTLQEIPLLVRDTIALLRAHDWQPMPSGETWERTALKQADMLAEMEIKPTDDEATIRRKVRAFKHPTKPGPYIVRHGKRIPYTGDPS